jgi:hypothetical protein
MVDLGTARPTFRPNLRTCATVVADLQALVDAFEDSTGRGWHRRTTIVVARFGTERALARGLDAVRTLDVIVGNTLAHEPTVMAVWRDIRRNDSRRQTQAPPDPSEISSMQIPALTAISSSAPNPCSEIDAESSWHDVGRMTM